MKYAIHISQEGEVEIRRAENITAMWDVRPMPRDKTVDTIYIGQPYITREEDITKHTTSTEDGIYRAYYKPGETTSVSEITPYDSFNHPSRVYNNRIIHNKREEGSVISYRNETRYVVEGIYTEDIRGEMLIELEGLGNNTGMKFTNEMLEMTRKQIEANIVKYQIDEIEYAATGHKVFKSQEDEKRYEGGQFDRYVGIIRTRMMQELSKENNPQEVGNIICAIEAHTSAMMIYGRKYLEHYKRDLEIDRWAIYREAALQKGKLPEYIALYREYGSNIEIMHCTEYYPKMGEEVRYLFGYRKREGLLDGVGSEIEYQKRNGNGSEIRSMIHHKDGVIKEIGLDEATNIVSNYKSKMLKEWSRKGKEEGYER